MQARVLGCAELREREWFTKLSLSAVSTRVQAHCLSPPHPTTSPSNEEPGGRLHACATAACTIRLGGRLGTSPLAVPLRHLHSATQSKVQAVYSSRHAVGRIPKKAGDRRGYADEVHLQHNPVASRLTRGWLKRANGGLEKCGPVHKLSRCERHNGNTARQFSASCVGAKGRGARESVSSSAPVLPCLKRAKNLQYLLYQHTQPKEGARELHLWRKESRVRAKWESGTKRLEIQEKNCPERSGTWVVWKRVGEGGTAVGDGCRYERIPMKYSSRAAYPGYDSAPRVARPLLSRPLGLSVAACYYCNVLLILRLAWIPTSRCSSLDLSAFTEPQQVDLARADNLAFAVGSSLLKHDHGRKHLTRSMAATSSTYSRYFVVTQDCITPFPRSVTHMAPCTIGTCKASRGRGGVVVKLLASHIGELGSIPDGDGAAGRRVFSGFSRFPTPFHSPHSPRFTFIGFQELDVNSRQILYASLACPSDWGNGGTLASALASHDGDPDFRIWESYWTTPLASRFSLGAPVSSAPTFQRRSILGFYFMSCSGTTGTYGPRLETRERFYGYDIGNQAIETHCRDEGVAYRRDGQLVFHEVVQYHVIGVVEIQKHLHIRYLLLFTLRRTVVDISILNRATIAVGWAPTMILYIDSPMLYPLHHGDSVTELETGPRNPRAEPPSVKQAIVRNSVWELLHVLARTSLRFPGRKEGDKRTPPALHLQLFPAGRSVWWWEGGGEESTEEGPKSDAKLANSWPNSWHTPDAIAGLEVEPLTSHTVLLTGPVLLAWGATMAERLVCSLPTKAIRVQPPAG
ncbi:hypothetical protein PR048_009770 [Dryococelus australis]|uniref:Uncharacterized protein n=1 Tax=Dryococelus australis TaxID=614101 RepID=A0ABQ9I0V6_9NEOP|nr:hypothetical protein PR048_009770 [Dryococelus australis]